MARYRANLLSRIRFQAKWDALKILDTEHFLRGAGLATCPFTSETLMKSVKVFCYLYCWQSRKTWVVICLDWF